jgi:hypothetical protein
MTPLRAVLGAELRVATASGGLESVAIDNVTTADARLLALLIVDTGVAACGEALRALHALARSLPARQLLILVLAVDESKLPLAAFLRESDPASCLALPAATADPGGIAARLVASVGIRHAFAFPEVHFLSPSGTPVAVGVWGSLKSFTPATFPSGWHRNVWTARRLPPSDPVVLALGPSFGAARADAADAERAGLYPGDPVIVRHLRRAGAPVGGSSSRQPSLCVYVNPPPPEGVEEGREGAPPCGLHELWLPPTVCDDLGLEDESALVSTIPYLEVPEARLVELAPLRASAPAVTLMGRDGGAPGRALVSRWAGLPSTSEAAGRAHALVEAIGDLEERAGHLSLGELAVLEEQVMRSSCTYAVLCAGQTVAVPTGEGSGGAPLASFRVLRTDPPFSAVVIAPGTLLVIDAAAVD